MRTYCGSKSTYCSTSMYCCSTPVYYFSTAMYCCSTPVYYCSTSIYCCLTPVYYCSTSIYCCSTPVYYCSTSMYCCPVWYIIFNYVFQILKFIRIVWSECWRGFPVGTYSTTSHGRHLLLDISTLCVPTSFIGLVK